MHRKSEIEMERAARAKTLRSMVRLRHSLAADRELNERLPATLQEFDAKVASGELLGTDVEQILATLVEG